MTNDELKKKIVEVIDNWANNAVKAKRSGASVYDHYNAAELADALIAAGIGDLKEHRIFAGKDGSIKQLYSGEEVEKIVKERKELKDELRSKVEYIHEQDEVIKEYKHRAEIAERALLRLCDETMHDVVVIMYPNTMKQVKNKQELYDYCMEQAEKELAEEGKDD